MFTYQGAKNSIRARGFSVTKSLKVSVLRSWTSLARAVPASTSAARDLKERISKLDVKFRVFVIVYKGTCM